MHTLVLGFGLGFVVAMQIGPMSLWLVRSTLRSGVVVGFAIGAGIAVIDAGYAAAGAAGAAPLLTIGPLETVLGLAGAAVMAVLGVRTLKASAREAAAEDEVASPRRAFLTSLAATASNPLTIASWAAVFAAAGAAGGHSPVVLVAGVGLGSLAWVSLLATGTAGAGRAIGPRVIRAADLLAGSAMLVFAAVLAAGAAA
ncbi:MAG TPA: LysE family transporter [Solirubrobacteraceae bacterium]|nr:LysE family transporter [Solirubrobacteraceae bacterium]